MPTEADKYSSTRKPLSDCTNTVAASLSAAASRRKLSLKSSVPRSSGCSSRIGDTASQKSNTSIGSNNGPTPTTSTAPSSVHHQYSPSLPQRRSSSGKGNRGKSAPSSTQKGKRNALTGKNKGKMVSQDSIVDKSYPATPSSLDLSSSAASGTNLMMGQETISTECIQIRSWNPRNEHEQIQRLRALCMLCQRRK